MRTFGKFLCVFSIPYLIFSFALCLPGCDMPVHSVKVNSWVRNRMNKKIGLVVAQEYNHNQPVDRVVYNDDDGTRTETTWYQAECVESVGPPGSIPDAQPFPTPTIEPASHGRIEKVSPTLPPKTTAKDAKTRR